VSLLTLFQLNLARRAWSIGTAQPGGWDIGASQFAPTQIGVDPVPIASPSEVTALLVILPLSPTPIQSASELGPPVILATQFVQVIPVPSAAELGDGLDIEATTSIIPVPVVSAAEVTAFAINLTSTPEVIGLSETHLGTAYEQALTTLKMGVWITRRGIAIASATTATVEWFNPNGTLLFSQTSTTPDSNGHFAMERVQVIDTSIVYYAKVSVTDGRGTIRTRRGIPTGA